jgi:hypothetical protein
VPPTIRPGTSREASNTTRIFMGARRCLPELCARFAMLSGYSRGRRNTTDPLRLARCRSLGSSALTAFARFTQARYARGCSATPPNDGGYAEGGFATRHSLSRESSLVRHANLASNPRHRKAGVSYDSRRNALAVRCRESRRQERQT